ncbi:hypothetical protein O3M35_009779 [Rhynocoris fuscipes]|uniref:Uncharacterized protein n=1 Tax=Rhynocoris fuscipes TaxID=488301 RepID=A0AAW1D7R9_9HEMI
MNEFWRYTAGTFLVFIMTSSSIIIYASCALFQFIFTFQISPYLKILQNRLETKGTADKTIYQNHKIVIQFLQDYNEIFSGQLLVEIMLASLYPCGFGYTLIKGLKNNDPPPLDTYLALILCFFGPFSMYYCGQEISTQMERLHESSYMSKWYEEKPKVRRDLYTMMLITIRPLTLNYRLFITFDLKCGTTIVQGIYSYLMMINNFETAD